eukprot:Phypoly_transcript_14776.p1 GENE.Phypoly_transcript_14776~~Phypoly_transcript_14776.p1  ORF type:complete len:249 (+),score=47.99 Phypoly_transcript_14776:125-871(+)
MSSYKNTLRTSRELRKMSQLQKTKNVLEALLAVQGGKLVSLLPYVSVRALVLVSSRVCRVISPIICELYTFNWDPKRKLQYFYPTKISCKREQNLPDNITHLVYEGRRPLTTLPSSLTHLTFGNSFNQHVASLPASLSQLTFGFYFNQPVEYLPSSITSLTFGHQFNQPVDHLPPSLFHLSFGHNFNQPITKLPRTIRHLCFGPLFSQSFHRLPSLTQLTFDNKTPPPSLSLFPSLVQLTISGKKQRI